MIQNYGKKNRSGVKWSEEPLNIDNDEVVATGVPTETTNRYHSILPRSRYTAFARWIHGRSFRALELPSEILGIR